MVLSDHGSLQYKSLLVLENVGLLQEVSFQPQCTFLYLTILNKFQFTHVAVVSPWDPGEKPLGYFY